MAVSIVSPGDGEMAAGQNVACTVLTMKNVLAS